MRVAGPARSRRGFTLLEVMVALGVLACGFLVVSQLLLAAARTARLSQATTVATALAARRAESFRLAAWGLTVEGTTVGEIEASPPDALLADTTGFVQYFDESGVAVGSGLSPPSPERAAFTARWSVGLEDGGPLPARTLVVRVVVLRREAARGGRSGIRSSWVEAVRMTAVRTRRPG